MTHKKNNYETKIKVQALVSLPPPHSKDPAMSQHKLMAVLIFRAKLIG